MIRCVVVEVVRGQTELLCVLCESARTIKNSLQHLGVTEGMRYGMLHRRVGEPF